VSDEFCPACGQPLEARHQGAWCRWHGKVLTCCEGPIDRPLTVDDACAPRADGGQERGDA
jgi:hypothetical protein